ncbi:MAG: 50S ribosomal protein L24 [Planctomycetaceae bacterium]
MGIRKGDLVVVIAGEDKGPTPHRVVQVLAGGKKIQVEGVHQVLKHVRRGHPKSPQGGRLQLDLPIDSSNVLFYCGNCAHGVRLGVKYTDDGAKSRYCKKCNTTVGTIGGPKARRATATSG